MKLRTRKIVIGASPVIVMILACAAFATQFDSFQGGIGENVKVGVGGFVLLDGIHIHNYAVNLSSVVAIEEITGGTVIHLDMGGKIKKIRTSTRLIKFLQIAAQSK